MECLPLKAFRACYDNPLFQESGQQEKKNTTSAKIQTTGTAVHHQHSTGRTRVELVPPPVSTMTVTTSGTLKPVVLSKASTMQRRRRMHAGVAVLVAAILVGLVVALIIHWKAQTREDGTERGNIDKVQVYPDQLEGGFRVVDGPFANFHPDLRQHNTTAFAYFRDTFEFTMKSVFDKSPYSDLYNRTEVVLIRPGSVRVDFTIFFHGEVTTKDNFPDTVSRLLVSAFTRTDFLFVIDPDSIYVVVPVCHHCTTPGEKNTDYHKISPTCEPLAVGFCLNRTTYRSTYLPNFLGHRSQNEAMSYSYSISELSQNKCYDYATDFWCTILAPECVNGAAIPPCRSFCEVVREKCQKDLFGNDSWPINCSSLPESTESNVCRPNPYKPGACQKIQGDVCEDVGYSYTSFPNLNGDISEEATNKTLKVFGMIQTYTHCYSHVLLIGCTIYLPKCNWNGTVPHHIIPPCRSLCQAFKERCQVFVEIYRYRWPKYLNCSQLPDVDDENVCIGYKQAHEPPDLQVCKKGQFMCDNNTCLDHSWMCDGYQDCKDNTDETTACASCQPDEFKCQPMSSQCIRLEKVCDGVVDCYEGVDEVNCVKLGSSTKSGKVRVKDSISGSWLPVCSLHWNLTIGNVVCNQLGYTTVLNTVFQQVKPYLRYFVIRGSAQNSISNLQEIISINTTCPNNEIVKLTCGTAVCGNRPAFYRSPLRIVGGLEVKPGTWPWVVSLLGGSAKRYFCSGGILNEEWVITAAHCLGKASPDGIIVRAANTRRQSHWRYRQTRGIKEIHIYPDYDSQTINHDIALLHLVSPLEFNDYVRPICLPAQGQIPPVGTRCMAAGWGMIKNEAPEYEMALRQVDLDIVSHEACKFAYDNADRPKISEITENMMCAGGSIQHDSCNGDSGSALMCREQNTTDHWYITGIVSWGLGCAVPNVPGVYTNISKYIHWIYGIVANYTDT